MARLGHLDDYFASVKEQSLAPAATSETEPDEGIGTGIKALARGFTEGLGDIPRGISDIVGADRDNIVYDAGDFIADLGPDLTPEEEASTSGKIGQVAGQLGSFFVPAGIVGGAAKAAKLGKGATTAARIGTSIGTAGAVIGEEQTRDLERTLAEQGKAPPTQEQITQAARYGAPGGLLEAGVVDLMVRLASRGKLDSTKAQTILSALKGGKKAAKEMGKGVALGTLAEGSEEALQNIYSNVVASDLLGYDEDRKLIEGTGESFGVGGAAGGILGAVMTGIGIKNRRRALDQLNTTEREELVKLAELSDKRKESVQKALLERGKIEAQAKKEKDRGKAAELKARGRKGVAEAVGRAKEKGAAPVGQDVREGFTQDRILAGGDGREAVGSTFISEAEAEERQKRAVKDFIDSQKTGEPRPLPGVLPQAKGIQEQEVLPSVDQRQEEIDKAFDRRERTLAAREEVSEANKEREIDEAFTAREEELAIREEGKEKEEDFDRAKDEVAIREELRKESDKAFVEEQQTQDELEREVPPSPAMEEAFSVAEEQRSAREEESLHPVEEGPSGVQDVQEEVPTVPQEILQETEGITLPKSKSPHKYIDPSNPENTYTRGVLPKWMREGMVSFGLNPREKGDRDVFKKWLYKQEQEQDIVELDANLSTFEANQTFSFSNKGRESLATKKRNTKRIVDFLKSNPNLEDVTFTTFTPDDMSHLPQAYQDYIKERNPRALFYKKKKEILVNLDGFKNTQDIKGGIIHELAGHYGLRKTLGSQFNHFISSALKNKKVRETMDSFLGERYKDLSSEGRMEEYLSELARTKFQGGELSQPQESFYKRAVAKIRHILRKIGLVNVSEEDINTVLRNSYAYTVEGKGRGKEGDVGEGVAELKDADTLYYRKPKGTTKILVNPSKREVYKLLKETKEGILRTITTEEGDHYLFDAEKATHDDIHTHLKLSNTQIRDIRDGYVNKDGGDYSLSVDEFFSLDVAEMSADVMREDAREEGVSDADIDITDEAYQAPIHRNEFYNNFSKRFTTMFRNVKRKSKVAWLSSLGGIAAENQYDIITSRSKGAAQSHTKVASHLSKQLEKLEDTQISIVREQWLNEDEFNIPGASQEVHDALQVAKGDLEKIQVALSQMVNPRTKKPYLSEEQLENSRGKYIHKVYWKYYNEYKGANKKTSFMNYLKQEKLAPDVRALAGEVRDAEFLIPNTIATIGRDVAMLEMYAEMDRVSKKYGLFWTLDPANRIDLKFQGKNHKWTLKEVEAAIQDTRDLLVEGGHARLHDRTDEDQQALQEQLEYLVDIRKANEGLYIAEVKKGMNAVGWKDASGNKIIPTDEDARAFLDKNYVRIPSRDKTWGALSGQMVRKEIYQDIVADNEDFDFQSADALKRALRSGGTLDKLTSFWKGTKTIYNPPYWIRNIFGNGYLLDTSSETPSHKLMKMTMEEINNTFSGKDNIWYERAKRFGLYATTFSSNELYFMQEDFKKRADLRKAIKENENTILPRAFYMLSDGYLKSGQWLAEHHSAIEGIFKQTSMRDFVERWEKSSGKKFDAQTSEVQEVVLGNAAKHANDSIFDYSKVPGWLRTARRTVVPFATFNYKMAGQLPKALINHPFKMSKYYVAPYLAAQALLHGGDMEEEDWEKVKKDMPHHMKGKSSLFMFPIKDEKTGKFKYIDMTYMLPPAIFADPLFKMGEGENPLDILTKDFGVLGGPVPQGLAMFLSNKDPFTGQEIKKKGATASDNTERVLTQIYSMWMPPVLTQHGVTGRLLDQAAIDMPLLSTGRQKSEFGTDRETIGESLSRLSGLTVGSFNPREARIRNIKREQFNINSARKEMRKQLSSRNISDLERLKIRDRYLKEIKQRQSKLREIL